MPLSFLPLISPVEQTLTSSESRSGDLSIMDAENLRATELRLGLPGANEEPESRRGWKRLMVEPAREDGEKVIENSDGDGGQDSKAFSKAQVVGWPPIRMNRKSGLQGRRIDTNGVAGGGAIYVKVSMDGAPYLRKIDLNVYTSYEELRGALEDMFKSFTSGDFSPAAGGGRGSSYAIAYEDKDGDWMLVGDVPWRMFISSCKRLRIMKGSEAKGLGSNS